MFLYFQKMEFSSSNFLYLLKRKLSLHFEKRNFLIFQEAKSPEKFLAFQKTETPEKFFIHQEIELSYISGSNFPSLKNKKN